MNSAIRHWRQRWRLPELRLLMLALIISVTVVTAVGFFSSRVENAMQAQAQQLLGGDLVITAARPQDNARLQQAQQAGLQTTATISFPSVASAGDKLQLSQLKAVSQGYPLRGELKTASQLNGEEVLSNGQIPARGEVWAEARLFTALGVATNAEIKLGQQTFKLSRVLTQEPDRGTNLFQFAPVLIMNAQDLPTTKLLTPASRATFSQLFAGDSQAIKRFKQTVETQLKPTERIRTLQEDLSSVQQALQRSGRFLNLAALLSVVLAGVAVVLTANSLMQRELSSVAVLKAMGLSRRRILSDYLSSLGITALIGSVLGIALGFVLQYVLAYWLGDLIDKHLPAPSLTPVFAGLFTSFLLLLGFALPQLLRLVDTSPMQIFQGALQRPNSVTWWVIGSVLLAVFMLLWWQAHDLKLALFVMLGLLSAIALFALLAKAGLASLQALSKRYGLGWLGLGGRSQRAVLLVVVFATGLFALLLLTTVRTDLINRWQASLPADAPDQFLINIQPQEVAPLQQFLQQHQLKAAFYPMIRGRLVAINQKPVQSADYQNEQDRRLVEREFNLSSFAELPKSNVVLQGQWFNAQTQGFSIEQDIGKRLHFGLGDQLTFDVAGQSITQTVTSVREVRWDSMQPNFFVIAAPNSMLDFPQTFITSIHVGEDKTLLRDLVKQFPSVTAIDVGKILAQIRALIEQASLAVQGIFVFTLFAGLVVLIAALQSQKTERQREIAILKTLGASQRLLKRRIWAEFSLLGAVAGLLAGLVASLASTLFGYFLFDLDWQISIWLLLLGGILGSSLVGIAGYLNLKPLLQVLPMSLLKSG
jgi:putative ABC transport system permease protein